MRSLLLAILSIFVTAAAHAAVITVNSASDAVANDGACTLREAITAANLNTPYFDCPAGTAGLDQISFNIGGGGAQAISVASGFTVTDPLQLVGSTQPGFAGTPLITVLGPGGPPFPAYSCFFIDATAPGSSIRSLAIGGFVVGIFISAPNTVIAGNYIGLDHTGLNTIPNQVGMWLLNPSIGNPFTGCVIGGPGPADRNIIASNPSTAIALAFLTPGNVVQGNLVGLNVAGNLTVPQSGFGIGMQGANGTLIVDNEIAGMIGGAIGVELASNGNTIQSNTIGRVTAPNGGGIVVNSSDDNVIGASTTGGAGGNTIAYSTFREGVEVWSGVRNSILTNSIHDNDGPGIDLRPEGATNNDSCDADTGANDLQNKPVLTRALVSGSTITIIGTLDSEPSSPYTLEFFSNPTADVEGQTFLGSTIVNTDATCSGAFAVTLPTAPALGTYVTATATDADRNTSEFSSSIIVVAALDVAKSFSPASILRNTETSTLTITIRNDNAGAQSNVSFSDVYPAGLVNTALATGDCGGSVISSIGGSSVALSNGTIAGGATCTITATVTASGVGSYVNTLAAGSVTSSATQNTVAATATLNVMQLAAPGVTKTFEPVIRRPGEPSLLTITFQNGTATPITGLAFSDTYPVGLVNVTPLNVSSTCGGTVTATAGGGSLSLSGGTIPASGTCSVAVMVVVNDYGSYVNTLPVGSITSANAAPNAAPVTAVLSASLPIPTLSTYALAGLAIALAFIAVMKRAV